MRRPAVAGDRPDRLSQRLGRDHSLRQPAGEDRRRRVPVSVLSACSAPISQAPPSTPPAPSTRPILARSRCAGTMLGRRKGDRAPTRGSRSALKDCLATAQPPGSAAPRPVVIQFGCRQRRVKQLDRDAGTRGAPRAMRGVLPARAGADAQTAARADQERRLAAPPRDQPKHGPPARGHRDPPHITAIGTAQRPAGQQNPTSSIIAPPTGSLFHRARSRRSAPGLRTRPAHRSAAATLVKHGNT